jgi:transposase-like protein
MTKYCKQDVSLLEKVYLRLRKYMKSHPNMSDVDECNCPRCGSDNKKKHQLKMTAGGIRRRQWQCKDCGGYFSSLKAEKAKPLSKL